MSTSFTPPIRSILTESSSINLTDENNLSSTKTDLNEQRRSSSSSSSSLTSTSSCFTDSLTSFHIDEMNEDDGSSSDSTHQQSNPIDTLSTLMPRLSLSISDENDLIDECEICVEQCRLSSLFCCAVKICCSCIYSHLSTNIKEGRIRISCPSCSQIWSRDQILTLLLLKDENGELAERYKRLFADVNGEKHIKTCPQCCAIKQIDKKIFEGVRWRRNVPTRVICDECQFIWCFFCHAPWHEKMNCKEYREGEKMFLAWTEEKEENQNNAQRCPRCKVFISRNGGCPHMICSKCHCDFCYNCGKRRFAIKFLGSHDSRLSPFGCKYNFFPNQPIVRHTVRGLVLSAATLAAPVAAVGVVALLAVGTTIGAPTYGTYRLVKHIKNKRRARRHPIPLSIQSDLNENNSTNDDDDDDDDLTRAVQASLVSFREETEKRDDVSSLQSAKDDDTFSN